MTPSCPSCPSGQICSIKVQSCEKCASTSCIDGDEESGPLAAGAGSGSKKGRDIGAIAGGVIGGMIFIAVVTWLIWRFYVKPRRQQRDEDVDDDGDDDDDDDDAWTDGVDGGGSGGGGEKTDRSTMLPHDRVSASSHAARSAVSSISTRASNVIQIAYIPGITNQSSTPGLLVPPVPPLPIPSTATTPASTPHHHRDQHFFMPELRDSTYSGLSDTATTFNRESMAPSFGRSSVATTIYRSNAVVDPVPAQTVIRGKAAVVSVNGRPTGQSGPDDGRAPTPPMPAVDYGRFGQRGFGAVLPPLSPSSPFEGRRPASPAFSVGSTFLSGAAAAASAARAGQARPVSVRRPSRSSVARLNHAAGSDKSDQATAAGADVRSSALTPSTSAASKHSRARRPDLAAAAAAAKNGQTLSLDDDDDDDDDDGDGDDDDDDGDGDDEPGARARKSIVRQQQRESTRTVIEETPVMPRSPFSDAQAISTAEPASSSPDAPPSGPVTATASGLGLGVSPEIVNHQRSGSLSEVIEEAARRAARGAGHGAPGSSNREPSPFSDANAVRTP